MAGGSERSVPHLPEGSSLEVVEKKAGKVVWRVVKDGSLVEEYNEEDIRFTVSCKFHLFRSEQEADQFYTGRGADSILDGLVRLIKPTEDARHCFLQISRLELEKKLPPGLTRKSPLHQLAPVIIKWVLSPC